MRSFFQKLWVKVRLAVIIILSITIGATWFYSIQQYQIIRNEADQVWEQHIERIENNKGDGGPVKAEPQSTPDQSAGEETSSLPAPGIEEVIYAYFQDDYKTAKAVFTAESGLNPNAQGFNCHYGGISQSCKKGDEEKAWSVDCGIAQINFRGKACPKELYDIDHNLEVARQKYEARKWQPWSAWKSGKYLAFL